MFAAGYSRGLELLEASLWLHTRYILHNTKGMCLNVRKKKYTIGTGGGLHKTYI